VEFELSLTTDEIRTLRRALVAYENANAKLMSDIGMANTEVAHRAREGVIASAMKIAFVQRKLPKVDY
jgi:hypothetical protein